MGRKQAELAAGFEGRSYIEPAGEIASRGREKYHATAWYLLVTESCTDLSCKKPALTPRLSGVAFTQDPLVPRERAMPKESRSDRIEPWELGGEMTAREIAKEPSSEEKRERLGLGFKILIGIIIALVLAVGTTMAIR